MSLKFFGQFLIECGEIDGWQLAEALALADRTNRTIGELARADGLISELAADRVNDRQRREDRPFGELAVEMGLLTGEQVEHLLRRQRETRLFLGEALVRLGHLPEDRLPGLLERFKIDQAAYEVRRGALPPELEGCRAAACVIDLLPKLGLRIARLRLKIARSDGQPRDVLYERGAAIRIHGRPGLELGITADRELARALAAGTAGVPPDRCDAALVLDGLGEFLNVLAGTAMGVLEREGHATRLDPPRLAPESFRGSAFDLVSLEGRGILFLAKL